MSPKAHLHPKKPRVLRCRGTRVAEVHGQFKNVPCKEPATETRELNPSVADVLRGAKPTVMHYCAKCAADWDSQQAILASIGV